MKFLRWVAVPIVAILTPFIAHFLLSIGLGLINWGQISIFINALVRDFCVGYATIAATTMVAPSSNKVVAIATCTIWCVFCVVSMILLFVARSNIIDYLSIILGIIGGVAAAVAVYDEEDIF